MSKIDKYFERGMAFLKGDSITKDYEQAFYWLNLAHELGSVEAETILHDMRKMSLGVPFDGEASENKRSTFEADRQKNSATISITTNASTESISLKPNAVRKRSTNTDRCIACGIEALVPSAAFTGARYCSPDKGGCGTNLMLPIVENGLNRGLALQPYRENIFGHRGSTHSSLGALVHMVKYDTRVDDALRIDIIKEIVNRIIECGTIEQLTGKHTSRDLIVIPAPSSKRRKVQPVNLLAKLISENGYEFDDVLTKNSRVESKSRPRGTELAPNEVRCSERVYGRAILLIDDTYGEGATLRACIRALRGKGAREIYFLSLCKNIFGGMKGSLAYDNNIY